MSKIYVVIGSYTDKNGKTRKTERRIECQNVATAISQSNTMNRAQFHAETVGVDMVLELKYDYSTGYVRN